MATESRPLLSPDLLHQAEETARARARGITEKDVDRLISEVRSENRPAGR